jgi:hypothetical protein
LVAGSYGIYTSTNSGATWVSTGAPSQNWYYSLASSVDGSTLTALAEYTPIPSLQAGIYISTNAGATWNPTTAPTADWGCLASSADGTKLVAGINGGGIYTSTNAGATWRQTAASSMGWLSIASSSDGSKLVAVANGSGIYLSIDSGLTWLQTSAPSQISEPSMLWSWSPVGSSADGTKLVAVVNGGDVYTAQATIQTTTTSGPAGDLRGGQNSAIELQYISNGQFMSLSREGAISAY